MGCVGDEIDEIVSKFNDKMKWKENSIRSERLTWEKGDFQQISRILSQNSILTIFKSTPQFSIFFNSKKIPTQKSALATE